MSNTDPMEQAAGQAVQTAAVALQVLVMAAKALREHQQREAAQKTTTPAAPPQQQPAPAPVRQPVNPDHERYAHLVRGTVQPTAVAEAMVNSTQWPQLADELKKLEGAGVNVGEFLRDAAPVISRMDTDLRAGSAAPGVTASPAAATLSNPWAPPPGKERDKPNVIQRLAERVKDTASKLWQRVTRNEKTSALGDRSRDLTRLGISGQENARLVVVAREALADEGALSQMVTSREWPGIASQMKALQETGRNPREALAGVPVRIQQAAAAGIKITPAEAARGLLTDQTKAPSQAPKASSPTAAPAPVAAQSGPKPGASPASSVSPDKVSYKWTVSYPGENYSETLRSGTVLVPSALAKATLEDLAVKELAAATRKVGPSDARLGGYSFSSYQQPSGGGVKPTADSVTMSATDPRVQAVRAAPAAPAGPSARAAAASTQSTTATPGATPKPGPQAAPPAPTVPSAPTRTQRR